mmetsp:Transcript_46599/g.107614  ORF Transcript_46599/g.107614 Transcript_46599/m.107614 type:complete len:398 (-) Transcript_46599:108-1301(-)|eukprot:CAMPEP_0171083188 /NCGR_PEP_ID=MMETSP0766_2-20121228/17563_1 /TAXON_ID=439317 /ORGANISM="Gambierdiscus australes, Strain CAWD 149" /LENGTH=397 /DNA_ID=CAMNT_0011540607 /DNA_START=22 /DNA_END=1215 /DNA_ORIENTATION=+
MILEDGQHTSSSPLAMSQSRSCTVFIGNIPYDALEDDLRSIFNRVGAVESLRLVYDKDTKQPKGYGFCDYSDPDTAMSAVRNLNVVECNGRRLRIDLADNALRSREATQKAEVSQTTASPLPLPATEPQPRPALPPAVVGAPPAPPQIAFPLPPALMPVQHRPAPQSSAGPGEALATEGLGPGVSSPEAVIAAVSAHTEIAQTVAAMPQAQLQLCLGSMQKLAVEAPESARALLQDNPQLCYALLHAQLLLGLTLEPAAPPNSDEMQRLRAEAAQRPAATAFLSPGVGVVVPPGAPGMPGGPPRPPLSGPLPLRAPPTALPATFLPVGSSAAQSGLRPPAVAPSLLGHPGTHPGPADIGLAPKGCAFRPPLPTPRPVAPGLAPKACLVPSRQPGGAG